MSHYTESRSLIRNTTLTTCSLQIIDLGQRRLLRQEVEIDLDFSSVVVDRLLVLHQAAEVLDVSLKQHLVTEVVKLYSKGTLPQQMGW